MKVDGGYVEKLMGNFRDSFRVSDEEFNCPDSEKKPTTVIKRISIFSKMKS